MKASTDIADRLGTTKQAKPLQIVLLVPSRDRDGKVIDHDYWVDKALESVGALFGGGTAHAQGKGIYRDDDHGGRLLPDKPTIIECYTEAEAEYDETLILRFRKFLHELGREANQAAVGLVFGGIYREIKEYDSEGV